MLFGIDCASVDRNRNPDWALAKARGPIAFALVRASEGTSPDPMFDRAWSAIRDAGLVRGAYLLLRFPRAGKAPASPRDQARAFMARVGTLEPFDLPCTLDIEFPGTGRASTGLSATEALDWIRQARDVIAAAQHVPPLLYTSARVWREDLGNLAAPDLADCPLWLARYFWKPRLAARRDAAVFDDGRRDPPVPPPWGDATNWWIHQYQGDALEVPGFTSTVDMNRFNTMTLGARGDRVVWVQRKLAIATSGQFDAAMARAVSTYQRTHHLVPDGVVGPRTFARLCWEQPA